MSKEKRLGRGLAALLGEEPGAVDGHAEPGPVALKVHRPEESAVERDPSPPPPGSSETPSVMSTSGAVRESTEAAEGATGVDPGDLPTEVETATDGDLILLPLSEIDENPFQPRREFRESEIASLAESLKEHDMLQPVLVRRMGTRWQLISGERRLRAAIRAGWTQIPARVRQANDRLVAELAIVENLQRKDLNPIEKALSFRRYLDQHKCTYDVLGARLKIDRSTIANLLRLLELPERVQEDLREGRLSAGHARTLLPLGDEAVQIQHADQIIKEGLSVRETENLVREYVHNEDIPPSAGGGPRKRKPPQQRLSPQLQALEQKFRMVLGTKVSIKATATGRGQISIHFRNADEFERLKGLLIDSLTAQLRSLTG